MLDFVKVHLSTILLTSATFVLTLIYLTESKWTITIVWALVTLINIARLAFAYFKKQKKSLYKEGFIFLVKIHDKRKDYQAYQLL